MKQGGGLRNSNWSDEKHLRLNYDYDFKSKEYTKKQPTAWDEAAMPYRKWVYRNQELHTYLTIIWIFVAIPVCFGIVMTFLKIIGAI
jgi:hypothetical protein